MFVVTSHATKNYASTWLIDSGCTSHMTPRLSGFKKLDQPHKSKVKIGNGDLLDVKGKGVVAVETPISTKYISDVLFVPEISQSLLSVGQMLEKNFSLYFQDKSCIIVDNAGCELMTVRMKEKSFPIKWKETNFYATDVDESTLWHKRFGHFHHTALKHLHLKVLAQGMPAINEGKNICQACQFGKQNRLSFLVNKVWRASKKL